MHEKDWLSYFAVLLVQYMEGVIHMRIGVFQFHCSDDILKNHRAIVSAIIKASENNVRLLVFHECAACGYPPVETPDIQKIDFASLEINFQEISLLAQKYDMFIVLGTIRREGQRIKHYANNF